MAGYEEAVTNEAAAYLLARGVEEATSATFRLGVVADPVPGHEKYRGWLAIPYLDKNGQPLTIRFRCMEEHNHREHYHGKYMSITDDPSRVFSIGSIFRATDEIHVTEGEFDAVVLNQLGLPAVAIPGASGFQGHHRRMLSGFSRVWVWGDPDEAGAEFTNRVCRMVRNAKGVRLRGGDVTDTYLKHGAGAITSLVA